MLAVVARRQIAAGTSRNWPHHPYRIDDTGDDIRAPDGSMIVGIAIATPARYVLASIRGNRRMGWRVAACWPELVGASLWVRVHYRTVIPPVDHRHGLHAVRCG
jgi:hypothetical protein